MKQEEQIGIRNSIWHWRCHYILL